MSKKQLRGKVISNKMHKTIVVAVEVPKRHSKYGKQIKNTKKFKVHTDSNINTGVDVTIVETAPYSKEVTWKVAEEREKN